MFPVSTEKAPCVVLVGMPGSGKTTVGQNSPSDSVCVSRIAITRSRHGRGSKIPTIFEIEGEDGFLQTQTPDELTTESGLVLATGGGAVINPLNRALLSERCAVVYLNVPPHILWERGPAMTGVAPCCRFRPCWRPGRSFTPRVTPLIVRWPTSSSRVGGVRLMPWCGWSKRNCRTLCAH